MYRVECRRHILNLSCLVFSALHRVLVRAVDTHQLFLTVQNCRLTIPSTWWKLYSRGDPLEGVLRNIFTMARIMCAIVRQVSPSHLSVPTFQQLRPSARRQSFRAMYKCVATFSKLLTPCHSAAVVAACVGDRELHKFISSMINEYKGCERGSVEKRMLGVLMDGIVFTG